MSLGNVGWTFMYRKYGMPRVHGCAGVAMSTISRPNLPFSVGLLSVDMNVHPTGGYDEFF